MPRERVPITMRPGPLVACFLAIWACMAGGVLLASAAASPGGITLGRWVAALAFVPLALLCLRWRRLTVPVRGQPRS